MASSEAEYLITRKKQIQRRQKIVTIVSMFSFFGSTVFAVIPAIQQATQPKPATASASAESGLQQQARGYELVLQRETVCAAVAIEEYERCNETFGEAGEVAPRTPRLQSCTGED